MSRHGKLVLFSRSVRSIFDGPKPVSLVMHVFEIMVYCTLFVIYLYYF